MFDTFGRYQFRIFCLCILCKFFTAFNQMGVIFYAPRVSYICADTNAETCPCSKPIYDTSVFTNTITMEWNLICKKKWLANLTQTLFQVGVLFGSVFFGMAADRYGRRNPCIVAVIIQLTMSMASAYATNYVFFCITRIFIGSAVGGTMVTTFVILMEFIGNKNRDVISALYHVPFNIGHMMLPLIAYYYRDYKKFLLVVSIPSAIPLCYFCFLPESARWLIAVNRTDEAIAILKKEAKISKRQVDIHKEVVTYAKTLTGPNAQKGNLADLFRTPNLRRNIICMSFNWMTCSYCFYGVTQYVGHLSGNIFINVAASGGVALFGAFTSIPLMRACARKTVVVLFHFLCAACLFALMFVPEGNLSVILACTGVVSSFIVFVVVYLYCSELFPTVVRNAAVGFSSMMARVGSMVAPFVINGADIAHWLPPLAFAILPLVACWVTFLLPETKDCELLTTLEEGENFGKNIANKPKK
ncbi:PREDICTED: organic cation transporter protein-like [Papilio xuthus]|uniref:Organic cation transporter protein-like n=1 Tax=Papilio xuthus TaxID=66420 RepID=A0AAJ6ZIH6_PAPXU|nr:PREDICTED: organic cation transporter protein-like [Papilio xuthus]XP_013173248.1 PREDICTED: organic cation transporter protein-like [Papilio xuthus]